MKYLLKHRALLIIICVSALILVMAVASLFVSGRATLISGALGSVIRPFQTLLTSIADGVGNVYGYMYDYDALSAENESLRAEVARLEEELRLLESAKAENERLRILVDLKESRPDFEFESVQIISRDLSNWARTFTIDKGSAHGLAAGNCVLSAEGSGGYLVGVISETALNWSTVITLIDTDMAAGAIVYRTSQTAVAEGRFDLMREGKLGLFYMPLDSDILIGDLVLTSGIGGVLPGDVPIGKISAVREEKDGMSLMAELEPLTSLDRLGTVYVVKSFGRTEDPEP